MNNRDIHIHIKADAQATVDKVADYLGFYLAGMEGVIDVLTIIVADSKDNIGTHLFYCQVKAERTDRPVILIEETQAGLSLAINRALDRCVRTLHRKQVHQLSELSA